MAGSDPLKKLAGQVGELEERVESVDGAVTAHTATLDEILKLVKQIQNTQGALASSVGLAMTELAIARSLERRVERLEAVVFPPKH